MHYVRTSQNWSVIYKRETVVKSTSRTCIGIPQTPRAEVDRPPPTESSAQPTTQFAVSPVACRSYSCLNNDLARNAILKRPYICKCICTMETRPALPIGFLDMQSLVAHAHMLWTKSSTLRIGISHCKLRYTSGKDSKSLALDQKDMPG